MAYKILINKKWKKIMAEKKDNQAEAVLRESEECYHSILQTAMYGFWLADGQGRFLEVNDAYCRMSGYGREELLTMSIADVEAMEIVENVAARIQKIMSLGQDRFESRHRCKDGSVIDVEVSVQYQSVKGGQFVGFVRDITKQKQTAREMFILQKAVDTSGEVIFITDPDGLITYINPAFTHLYGYTESEVVGQVTPRILKSGRMTEDDYKHFWQALLNKEVVRGELINKAKDGRLLIIEGSASAILSNTGKIVGYLAIQYDITKRKQIEHDLRQAENQVKTLRGLLPICANCKKIRDDKGEWIDVAVYVGSRTEVEFSHGICPDCLRILYGKFLDD